MKDESGQYLYEYVLVIAGVALALIISAVLVLDVYFWKDTHPEVCYTQEALSIGPLFP